MKGGNYFVVLYVLFLQTEIEGILYREAGRERNLKKPENVAKAASVSKYNPVQGKAPPTNSELVQLTAAYIAYVFE